MLTSLSRTLLSRTLLSRTLLAGVGALGLAVAIPAAATTDDASRYWAYYQWDGDEWAFASFGPGDPDNIPADGAVEGWRHAVTGLEEPRLPRANGDFDLICAGFDADEGQKRVAVVLDFGTADDAADGSEPPAARGACAVVPEDATGADVLAAATGEVRYDDSGLTCGIASYPATGCWDAVEGDAPTGVEESVELALPQADAGAPEDNGAADSDDGGGVPVGLIVGAGAVVVIGGAAVAATRRSRAAA